MRRRHQRRQAGAGGEDPEVQAGLDAQHHRGARPEAADAAAPHDQRERRPGHGGDQQHGDQEGRQAGQQLHAVDHDRFRTTGAIAFRRPSAGRHDRQASGLSSKVEAGVIGEEGGQ